jgi:hypothetical protein
VKNIKKASEIRDLLESVIDENRIKIVVVDAPEIHSERILDVLNKTLQKGTKTHDQIDTFMTTLISMSCGGGSSSGSSLVSVGWGSA